MTGVQLIGKKAILSRFEALDGDAWALYQGKQFIVAGVGSDALEAWIDCFIESGSTATYLLRVYEGDQAPTSSTANADYIACISFKIVDTYEGHGIAGHSTKLLERLGAIEKRLQDQDDDETDNDDTDLNTVIMGWLTDPVKLNQVAGAVRTMFGVVQPAAAAGAAPIQTIAGFSNPAETADPVTRIAAALDILEKRDPKLVEHLEKLAALAQSDPGLFNAVVSKLDVL